jgi:ribose transport system permease protein
MEPNELNKNFRKTISIFLKNYSRNRYYHELSLLIGLGVLFLVFSQLTPYFWDYKNILVVLQQVSITTIIGFGMAFIIISQGIDLSVGSATALIGYPIVTIAIAGEQAPLFAILGGLSGIAVGMLIGFINGVNIVYLRIPAFIATLAMMTICRGLVLTITDAQPFFGLPDGYIFIGNGFVGPVPMSVIILLAVFGIVTFIAEYTRFGKIIYAIGGNEEAVRVSGINVKKMRILIYLTSGTLVGLAGVIYTARVASCQPWGGEAFLFHSVTATILGGVSIAGGSGSMLGVLLGGIVIGIINNGLALLNVNPFYQRWVRGLLVLFAITITSLRKE